MARVQHVDQTAHSQADAATIYEILLDRPSWPTWSPLESFEPGTDGPGGSRSVGAIGTFVTGRTRSEEEIVELIPARRLSYRLLSGLPMRNYRADIDLSPVGTGTDIRWHSSFNAAWPGTGWMFRFAFNRFIAKMVTGLARHADNARESAKTADSV